MIKQIILLLPLALVMFITNEVDAQTNINQKDKNGKKTGLWIENGMYGLEEAYYQDGKYNGFFRSYSKGNKSRLSSFGSYLNGKMSGDWYFIDDKSHVYMSCEDIKLNKDLFVNGEYNKKVRPSSKAYIRLYHKNGKVEQEGLAIFDDVEIDFYRIGKWVFRDEKGKEIEIKNFHKPTLID